MLLKWIVCRVPTSRRSEFSGAQQRWAAVRQEPGFMGQVGGWDESDGPEACIASLWRDAAAYAAFMRDTHDRIHEGSKQAASYDEITVSLFDPTIDMPGTQPTLAAGVTEGRCLRIAQCQVKAGRLDHFVDVQQSIWIPGMRAAPGMVGGCFGYDVNSRTCLVATLWRSEEEHQRYVSCDLPALRSAAGATIDLDAVRGRFIALEDTWTVRPTS